MPALFLAHGAPPLLDDAGWLGELNALANTLPKPTSVLMLSAHWETKPIALGATQTVPLVYDFYGFPQRYYDVKYPAPGAPQLAERVLHLLEPKQPVTSEPERGLDHGAFVPLLAMYPKADVPVLQVSLPSLNASDLFELGKQLAPLRDEGVLIIGSGFITHNLRAGFGDKTPQWAQDFDGWTAKALEKHDVDALLDYRARAPGVRESLPTHEHFVPLLAAVGAAAGDRVSFPITGWWFGGFTRRSVQLG
ncbi:MAG: dioxygenase [Myxococcaceae bacterium]|nr:dioxygenase [Myxococcaceae bacterium]